MGPLRCGAVAFALASAPVALAGPPVARSPGMPSFTGLAPVDGEVPVGSLLLAPATIERDFRGMARVEAADLAGAAFAQGFAHAQDRFFQMDLFRRLTAGRLSELMGASTLGMDRSYRRYRFEAVAEAVLARSEPRHAELLTAYAQGVNAGLAAMPGPPPEYRLLGATPQPWTDRDSAVMLLFMFIALSGDYGAEAAQWTLARSVAPEVAAFVFPSTQRFDAPMVGPGWSPADAPPVPGPGVVDWRGMPASAFDAIGAGRWPVDRVPIEDTFGFISGSNAWAVAGSRTGHGAAMLASDMHMPLMAPGVWCPVELRWGGGGWSPAGASDTARGQAVGLSLPGLPGIIAGSNGLLAWGFTNLISDVMDRVLIELDPADGTRYLVDGVSTEMTFAVETIEIRGSDPVFLAVPSTIWGPLIERVPNGERAALAWTALRPECVGLGLLDLLFAGTVDEGCRVVAESNGPPLNAILADVDGAVAWCVAGWLPERRGFVGTRSALWSRGVGWAGPLPMSRRPSLRGPGVERVWSSNHRGGSLEQMALVGSVFASPTRAHRARAMLDGVGFIERDFFAMQHDVRAEYLDAYAAWLREAYADQRPRGKVAEAAFDVSMAWDGSASASSHGYRWLRALRFRMMRELVGGLLLPALTSDPWFSLWPPTDEPVRRLLEERPAHLLPPGHADWDGYVRGAFERAVAEEAGRRDAYGRDIAVDADWGEVNRLDMRHAFTAALPAQVAGLVTALNMPRHRQSGDVDTVRVARPGFGASNNLVVAPGREHAGILTIPGGISGNPFSPHYRDRHAAWAGARPEPLLVGEAVSRLTLVPARD